MRKNKFLAALAIAACLATSVPLSANAATLGQATDASKVTYAPAVTDAEKALLFNAFDAKYYAEQNPDLVAAGLSGDALFNHFITRGIFEARSYSADFNVSAYKSMYGDLRDAYGNQIVKYYIHYLTNGKAEKRLATVDAVSKYVDVVSAVDGVVVAKKQATVAATPSTSTSSSESSNPGTDKPNTDKPNTDKPNTDKPNTDVPTPDPSKPASDEPTASDDKTVDGVEAWTKDHIGYNWITDEFFDYNSFVGNVGTWHNEYQIWQTFKNGLNGKGADSWYFLNKDDEKAGKATRDAYALVNGKYHKVYGIEDAHDAKYLYGEDVFGNKGWYNPAEEPVGGYKKAQVVEAKFDDKTFIKIADEDGANFAYYIDQDYMAFRNPEDTENVGTVSGDSFVYAEVNFDEHYGIELVEDADEDKWSLRPGYGVVYDNDGNPRFFVDDPEEGGVDITYRWDIRQSWGAGSESQFYSVYGASLPNKATKIKTPNNQEVIVNGNGDNDPEVLDALYAYEFGGRLGQIRDILGAGREDLKEMPWAKSTPKDGYIMLVDLDEDEVLEYKEVQTNEFEAYKEVSVEEACYFNKKYFAKKGNTTYWKQPQVSIKAATIEVLKAGYITTAATKEMKDTDHYYKLYTEADVVKAGYVYYGYRVGNQRYTYYNAEFDKEFKLANVYYEPKTVDQAVACDMDNPIEVDDELPIDVVKDPITGRKYLKVKTSDAFAFGVKKVNGRYYVK